MTVTWWTASGIILYHQSIAYQLSIYCSSFIYFSVAIAIITTKYQKHYFCYHYLLLPLPLLSYYFATKHFAADIKFPSVVELTTQLLILENILCLPLCRINNFGLNTLPSKTVVIPYTCGLSHIQSPSCKWPSDWNHPQFLSRNMSAACKPLTTITPLDQILCIRMSRQPIETVMESLSDQGFWTGMVTTISFVDLTQNLTTFLRRHTTLKRPCYAAMMQLPIDNGHWLGSPDYLPGQGFIVW